MFEWEYIKKVDVSELVAKDAVKLARDYGLKPADSIHAASAIHRKVSVLQRWDRDFSKVGHLITVEEPKQLTETPPLLALMTSSNAQKPEDNQHAEARKPEQQAVEPITTEVSGGNSGLASGQAPATPAQAAAEPTATSQESGTKETSDG